MTMDQQWGHFGYQIVQIIKSSCLGVGSYGAVYRAVCDELPCAAKIMHPTLFETHDPGSRKITERFGQECQFLSGVRHPHIVQYLGVSRDPKSGLPVLLMELMDGSLTRFLEQSQEPLPFHIQVDICYDIVLALAYLHSNGIIHRDLSSNNVLLIGPGNRAKVTDFGMSRLADANPHMTPMTMCPGTLVYMPPEALDDSPVYTNKLDCFSFGVLDIQVLTRQFPNPSQHCEIMEIDDPRFPTGRIKVPVPEVERRQFHIDLINPAHPMLSVALSCLKDREKERPSAQEICHRLAALKETQQYGQSVRQAQRAITDGESGTAQIRILRAEAEERETELEQLRQQHEQQIENFQGQIQEKDNTIETIERQIQEKDQTLATREGQLQQRNQQLEANEQLVADFQRKDLESEKMIQDLGKRLVAKDQQIWKLQQHTYDPPTAKLQVSGDCTRKGPLCLYWTKCGVTPHVMTRPSSSVVDGNMAYFNPYHTNDVYCYNSEKQTWSSLPQCPHSYSSLAVVNGLLTAIGGRGRNGGLLGSSATNQLLSLTGDRERKWVKKFPSMPTKRYGSATVRSGKSLVVAGGETERSSKLNTAVEVLDTDSLQWSTASSLPFALRNGSATICQDHIYLSDRSRSVLACSVADILQSCQSQKTGSTLTLTRYAAWHRVANLPVQYSNCATLCGQLLAVGGKDDSNKRTTAIHQYNPATDSWEVISHMPTARFDALVAVLHGNKLMVVGGTVGIGSKSNTVEIATLQE